MYTFAKFTEDVNISLNYPAVSFDDIRLFLDQAISEVNTELHTSIKSVPTLIEENNRKVSAMLNIVVISDTSATIPVYSEDTDEETFYYNSTEGKYVIYNAATDEHSYYNELYGVVLNNGVPNYYKAARVWGSEAYAWFTDSFGSILECDLENYFTPDWIKLFLIPYVCFKYSVRDGDTGRLFNEEFSQGFQQLRKSYNVPFNVKLSKVAGLEAYRVDVENNLPNLNIMCPTRAITESMRNPQNVNASYRDFYDVGGFGI